MDSCRKYNCSLCCLGTDVPLLNEDVERLRSRGHIEGSFVRELGGMKMLVQKDCRCVFLGEDENCRVYPYRPARCRLLPYTYDFSRNRSELDNECRYLKEYRISRNMARKMYDFIGRLMEERNRRLEYDAGRP